MSQDLSQLRQEIDTIDRELIALFRTRMDVAGRVAEYKRSAGLPVLDPSRERALLAKVADLAGEELADYTQSMFRTIMAASRSYQHRKLENPSQIYTAITGALAHTPPAFPQRASVACQGVEGAYSQIACDSLFKTPSIQYHDSFQKVFQAVERSECQYGVLPVENSTAGSVNAIYDLMAHHDFSIVRSARLKVSHQLLAKPGASLGDLREIFSHQQALDQSAGFLSTLPGVKITVAPNTAMAAQMVAQSPRGDVAALSSRACAPLYGLHCLAADVQDQDNNYTRFLCIAKHLQIFPGADRTSFMMTLPHRPGALYQVLSKFYALGLNLLKLESRPLPDREFEFMFYFDLEGSVHAPELRHLCLDLECECETLRYLGTYQEIIC